MFTNEEARQQYLEYDRKRYAHERGDGPHPGEMPPDAKRAHNDALSHLARLTETRWRQRQANL